MTRAGQRDAFITIQRYTSGRDAVGGVTETWATHKTCWAAVQSLSGSETEQGGRVDSKAMYKFNIRYADVTPDDRISWKGRIFNIERVADLRLRSIEMDIFAVEDV